MLSGDNGLLKRAGDARDDTIVVQEKEQVELAYVSAAVKKLGSDVDKDDLQEELDVSVGNNKTEVSNNEDSTLNVYFTETEHNYNVNGGTVAKIEDSTIKITEFSISGTSVAEANIPVPTGFTHTEGTKDTGYVIQDGDGNEFVWVPVDKNQTIKIKVSSEEKISSIVLTNPVGEQKSIGNEVDKEFIVDPSTFTKTYNGIYRLVVTTEEGNTVKRFLCVHSLYAIDHFDDFFTEDKGYEDWEEGENFSDGLTEPSDTINYTERVAANGGFYIGRYETGKEDSNLVIQANKNVWNNISHSTALSTAKTYNESLNSSLLTGAAWDRTLGWLYETGNKKGKEIVEDSTNWGNYNSSVVNTGETSKAVSNNIYDLAGNVWEWTTEAHENDRVIRSGGFLYDDEKYPAYHRHYNLSPSSNRDNLGFRVALYL